MDKRENKFVFIDSIFYYSLFFIIFLGILLFVNYKEIISLHVESGDFAANSLLILKAKSFKLLCGNYSRLGFNHPGPAILYVLAFGEIIFYDWLHIVSSPLSGQIIAVAFYNAFWIVCLLKLFSCIFKKPHISWLNFSLFLLLASIADNGFFSGLWFPHLYFFPFVVALFSFIRLADGDKVSLPLLAISGGVLINGHACFVSILAILTLLTVLYNHFSNNKNILIKLTDKKFYIENKNFVIVSFLILSLLLLPLLINTIINFPGPISEYIKFGSAHKMGSLPKSIKFIALYWGGIIRMLIGIFLCISLLIFQKRKQDFLSELSSPTAIILIATIAMLFYALFGVDIYTLKYIGLFYYSVPILFVCILANVAIHFIKFKYIEIISFLISFALLVCCYFNIKKPLQYSSYYCDHSVEKNYKTLPSKQLNKRMVFNLNPSGQWGENWGSLWTTVVGVELYANRLGNNNLFCINKNWHILFTKEAQCSEQEIKSNTVYDVTIDKTQKVTYTKLK